MQWCCWLTKKNPGPSLSRNVCPRLHHNKAHCSVHSGLINDNVRITMMGHPNFWLPHWRYTISCNEMCTARAHKNGRLEEERVTPIEAHSPGKIIELLLKIEHLVTCKSRAADTSTSKLGYHLETKSLTSLSAQNLFADFAKCNKKCWPSGLHHSHVELVGCYALHQARDTCAVRLLFLIMVQ